MFLEYLNIHLIDWVPLMEYEFVTYPCSTKAPRPVLCLMPRRCDPRPNASHASVNLMTPLKPRVFYNANVVHCAAYVQSCVG